MAKAQTWRSVAGLSRDKGIALIRAFRTNCLGATAIEYGLIGFLIFAVCAGTIKVYTTKVNNVYNTIGTAISQAP